VYEDEPPKDPSRPLIHHPRVISTPHLGANTRDAQVSTFNKTGSGSAEVKGIMSVRIRSSRMKLFGGFSPPVTQ
jgi:hypothetical protein